MTNPAQQVVPFSQEAEEAFLGGVLVNPKLLDNIDGILKSKMFFLKRHEYVFDAIMRVKNDPLLSVDLITVSNALRESNHLDEIGGQSFLLYCVNNCADSMHTEVYARLIERTDRRRQLLILSDDIRKDALNEEITLPLILANTDSKLTKLADRESLHRVREARDVAQSVYDEMIEATGLYNNKKDYMRGISTGFPTYDKLTNGIIPGYITVLAGPTGVGKTAWILNVIYHALRRGVKYTEDRPAHVVIFCGEMTEEDLTRRMLAMMTGIDADRIEHGRFLKGDKQDIQDQKKVIRAIEEFKTFPLHFETGQRVKTDGLKRSVRNYLARKELDLLVLDSILQVDTRESQYKQDQDWLKINGVMEELEEIAQMYRIPILCTAQIGRTGYKGNKTEPSLSDLKRSSGIEEKAAIVNLLYETDEKDNLNKPIIRNKIAKNRKGKTGNIDFIYAGELTRFYEVEKHQQEPPPHYMDRQQDILNHFK